MDVFDHSLMWGIGWGRSLPQLGCRDISYSHNLGGGLTPLKIDSDHRVTGIATTGKRLPSFNMSSSGFMPGAREPGPEPGASELDIRQPSWYLSLRYSINSCRVPAPWSPR